MTYVLNHYKEFKMKLLKLKQVIDCTGLARSTIYKFMDESMFPKQVSLGGRNVAWLESEVHEWILDKIEKRDKIIS